MEKKKLPEIIITGTPQELVEIEPLLVMAGYNQPKEDWNNIFCNDNCEAIHCEWNNELYYHTHASGDGKKFVAREIHKILHYIETGEIKEYCEDMQVACHGPIMRKTHTHTGQTKVVGNRIGDKPYTLKDLMSNGLTSTHPVVPNYVDKIKNHVKESKLRDWKKVEKAFKRWSDPDNNKCISYYSPTQQHELIQFFKKHFTK